MEEDVGSRRRESLDRILEIIAIGGAMTCSDIAAEASIPRRRAFALLESLRKDLFLSVYEVPGTRTTRLLYAIAGHDLAEQREQERLDEILRNYE